jgi:protein SCO1/2
MSSRVRRLALPIVALTIGVVALATAVYLTILPRGGSAVSVGGPFSLVAGTADRHRPGHARRPYLVFFGFTHCPDICPTKLFQMSEVFRAMGPKGEKLRALFITVDPERDTPELMKSYVSSFDGRIIGLTGERAAIDKVVRDFRGMRRRSDQGRRLHDGAHLARLPHGQGRGVHRRLQPRAPSGGGRQGPPPEV